VNLHEDIPEKVNKVFANQPLYPKGSGSNPPRPPWPPRYFGLPMVNLGKPPLRPNRPYCRPLNYLEYVKDSNPNVHVKVFKVAIRENSEIDDVNMFNFTLKNTMFDGVTIIWEITQIVFL